jgi:acetylornithine/succinyldiaminopimelate/putrescine aminotransferase
VAAINKDNLFQPKRTLAYSRSTETDKVFRAIVDAEAAYTAIKTARTYRHD